MRGTKLPVAGLLFITLFAVYLVTFGVPAAAVLLTFAPFIPLMLLSAGAAIKIRPGNAPQAGDRKRGSVWVIAALLLAAAITYFPFQNFGKERDGFYHYRASFWAVSMKHLAVVNTLSRDAPFINPYFQGEPLHYYYLSSAFPAALRESGLTNQAAP